MVDSCRECDYCKEGLEQYCEEGNTGTYNSPDKHLGTHTYGGYSESIVVNESFVLSVPENLDPAATAPLLCAGITTYSPLKHWNVGPGKKVGIVGIGGLGHMGVKLAKAMGAEVIVFTTSPSKFEDAKRLVQMMWYYQKTQRKWAGMQASYILYWMPFPHNTTSTLT
jgi:uncharacterized zinc-type alcohol dehydrogenase-like protein